MSIIDTTVNSMITMMMVKFMMNDIPHSMFTDKPTSSETEAILSRTGLGRFQSRYFPPGESETTKKRKPPLSVRTKAVGPYEVRMELRKDSCMIKLYEFLVGGRTKLLATWTGGSKPECEAKFTKVVETITQVRLEEKTRMMK